MPPGDAPVAGVIGWPVAHSLSPALFAFWLERAGARGHYVPLPVRPDGLEAALAALAALGFKGVNVTVPHKEAAARHVHRLDPAAARIGAVNLVLVDRRGRLEGCNTDACGFLSHLSASAAGWRSQGNAALLLGAGGAARAVAAALLDAGIERLVVVNRSRARADALVSAFADRRFAAAGWQDRSALLREVGLVVNCTTLGMAGNPPLDLELSLLAAGSVVCDLVYRPLKTPLLAEARARRLTAVDGLGMLVHQAVPAAKAFFGIDAAADEESRQYLCRLLGEE